MDLNHRPLDPQSSALPRLRHAPSFIINYTTCAREINIYLHGWLLITDKETRRQGDKETRRQGDKETRKQGDYELMTFSIIPTVLSLRVNENTFLSSSTWAGVLLPTIVMSMPVWLSV